MSYIQHYLIVIIMNQSFYIEQRLFKPKNTVTKCVCVYKVETDNCKSQNLINIALNTLIHCILKTRNFTM